MARDPAAPALRFFEDTITFGSLDYDSEALGAALAEWGVGRGDRVAVFLQNDPQFAVAQLGEVMVSVNPMLKEQELRPAGRNVSRDPRHQLGRDGGEKKPPLLRRQPISRRSGRTHHLPGRPHHGRQLADEPLRPVA